MRRTLLVLVVAIAVCLGVAPAALAGSRRELLALSYNIHHGAGLDGVVDLARVAAEIRRSGAGVVGLQEVDRHFDARSGFADQPAELARMLGMQVAYAPNVDLDPLSPGAPRRQYGTAVLTRFPIASVRHTLLPGGSPERRGLLETVIDVGGVPVRFMTTHLDVDSAAARVRQAQMIAAAVAGSAEPVVLTGDLNAPPAAPEVATLTALLTDTHSGGGGSTIPSDAPAERIDYVLSAFAGTCTVPATTASDHRPVLATLLVGGPSRPAPTEAAGAHRPQPW
jgi:endonuclease/exonuclease/phosphatase family metal-dependent hydrolase